MKRPVLPTYYYHDHFTEMLSFVSITYAAFLDAHHREFMTNFETLSKDAQCLYIRMINRRGKIFNRGAFRYAEISNPPPALDELDNSGLVRNVADADFEAFVGCQPKDALVKCVKDAGHHEIRTSWSRSKLVTYCLANLTFIEIHRHLGGDRFVAMCDTEPVEFLLYLYFGRTQDDLKNFALRDLGILRTNNKIANLSARFADETEARACFHYSRLLDRLEGQSDVASKAISASILDGPICTTDYAADLRGKAAYKCGVSLEKLGQKEDAARLYRIGASTECNERLVRLLYAEGDQVKAEQLLRQMIDDPASDDEFVFASDFYARKFGGQKTSACTALLRAGSTITVDDTWRGNPEAGVAGALRRQGYKVHYTENTLWRCLFGLLFWDQLFESGQIHSGFDRVPQCLTNGTFKRLFLDQINKKLACVVAGEGVPLVLRTLSKHWGKLNGIFGWDWVDIDAMRALLSAQPKGVAAVLRQMCEDYSRMRDGFPDLMTEKEGAIAFIEVKAEGDAVRRNQLTRLRHLGAAGFDATIARVDFRFDPAQNLCRCRYRDDG